MRFKENGIVVADHITLPSQEGGSRAVKKVSLIVVVVLSTLFCATPAVQALELSPMFTDNMVLQREKAVPVWGWAKPGSAVAVTFAGKTVKAKVDSKGYWYAKIKPMKANKQPQTMTIEGDGDWKLIKWYKGQTALFNLKEDMEEKNELSATMPEKVKELDAKLMAHLKATTDRIPFAKTE